MGRCRPGSRWPLVGVGAAGVGAAAASLALAALVAVVAPGVAVDRSLGPALSPLGPGQGLTVLVVGSDARETLGWDPAAGRGASDSISGARADAIALVKLAPAPAVTRVLSVPRDLLVEVDGIPRQKLSWVLGHEGRAGLVRTVAAVTGIPIHHYLEVDFAAFVAVVDLLGGIPVDLAHPGRDDETGFHAPAGMSVLDGTAALALARSRQYQELRGDVWVRLDDGDEGRIGRQHTLLAAAVGRRPHLSPAKALAFARAVDGHVTVDAGLGRLGLAGLSSLARRLAGGEGRAIDMDTLPTRPLAPLEDRISPFGPPHLGAVGYVVPAEPGASAAVAAFLALGSPL